MPKFSIVVRQIETWTLELEAASEEEARGRVTAVWTGEIDEDEDRPVANAIEYADVDDASEEGCDIVAVYERKES